MESKAPRDPLSRSPEEGEHDETDRSTWPQRILVAFMATTNERSGPARMQGYSCGSWQWDSKARKSDYVQRDTTRASRFVS